MNSGILAKIVRTEDCWAWTGRHLPTGYSITSGRKRNRRSPTIYVHRALYEHYIGPIPQGLIAHHRCRNKGCVNPWHLELMTRGDHQRLHFDEDGTHPRRGKHQAKCKRGHRFTPENTYLTPSGWRVCVTCRRLYKRKWRKRQSKAALVASLKGIGG